MKQEAHAVSRKIIIDGFILNNAYSQQLSFPHPSIIKLLLSITALSNMNSNADIIK